MADQLFTIGQRYRTTTEPELGLGQITSVDQRTVTLFFPVSSETRCYVHISAPLKRVIFSVGDTILLQDGQHSVVVSIREKNGLALYKTESGDVPENLIASQTELNRPIDRLLTLQIDSNDDFNLRLASWHLAGRIAVNRLRGMVGGRINLFEHQIYIAHRVIEQDLQRVLLADEVGLGKTVEALIIIHRLLRQERISRILLFVPDTLLLQWRAELFYRYSINAVVVDKRLSDSFNGGYSGNNIFNEYPIILTSPATFMLKNEYSDQVMECQWDMLVVDEVHHYQNGSIEFALLSRFTSAIKRILFLTAAPLQLGLQEHFARLQLLDPDRFHSFEEFEREYSSYNALVSSMEDTDAEDNNLSKQLLIDRFGPGRIIFRNTRHTVTGFPGRSVTIHPLQFPQHPGLRERLLKEFVSDMTEKSSEQRPCYSNDPRIPFILECLKNYPDQKFVLFCCTKEKVIEINRQLQKHNVSTALFHEDVPLDKRDNAVLWFISPRGARLLLCSEAGSEGRNFQVTNHCIMFDLPPHLELLEQRIGRLDRIGQRKSIVIHLPLIHTTAWEVPCNIFHSSLNAFETVLNSADIIMERFRESFINHAVAYHTMCKSKEWNDPAPDYKFPSDQVRKSFPEECDKIINFMEEAHVFSDETRTYLEKGRDRLLEQNSFDKEIAEELVESIRNLDDDTDLEYYMLDIFEKSGIRVKLLSDRTYHLSAGRLSTDIFPVFTKEGVTVTFDRNQALARDDHAFITIDHPFVERAFDYIVRTDTGSVTIAYVREDLKHRLLLEAVFIVECNVKNGLIRRFLPPSPHRFVIDREGNNVTAQYEESFIEDIAKDLPADSEIPASIVDTFAERIKELMLDLSSLANIRSESVKKNSKKAVDRWFSIEMKRLSNFINKEQSGNHRTLLEEHRNQLQAEHEEVLNFIQSATVRLDSLRIIVSFQ